MKLSKKQMVKKVLAKKEDRRLDYKIIYNKDYLKSDEFAQNIFWLIKNQK